MTPLRRSIHLASLGLLFGLSWLGGCSASSKEGVVVTVDTEAPSAPPLANGTRSFRAGDTEITVTRAYLNTGSVEILACTTAMRWLDFFRIPEARAHVVGSPTLLGVPSVESLLAGDEVRTKVGELHPPPGSYCRVKQTILAADPDAPGSPADGSMLGRSLLIEGTFAPSVGDVRPFRLTSTASFDVETSLDALALSVDGRRTATVVLSMANSAWFDGVDLAGDSADAATRVLENLRAALGARVE